MRVVPHGFAAVGLLLCLLLPATMLLSGQLKMCRALFAICSLMTRAVLTLFGGGCQAQLDRFAIARMRFAADSSLACFYGGPMLLIRAPFRRDSLRLAGWRGCPQTR